MKSGKFFGWIAVILLLALAGCSSGGNPPPNNGPHTVDFNDTSTPVVDIYTPGVNQVFLSGDTIKITGRVTDNGLYQGFVRITDDASTAVLKEQQYEIHGFQLYDFAVNYKTAVTVTRDYTITVQFQDHGLNAGSKIVKVKVNP